jgi:alpha-L-fucosidase
VPSWNWRSTTTADKIYIELFTWPNGSFHLQSVPRTVISAYLLADPERKPLKVTQKGGGIDIQLPAKTLDPIATVLVLNTGTASAALR